MDRRRWVSLAVLALLLPLAACGGSTDPDHLEGTWKLTEFGEDEGVKGSAEITVSLRDGRLGGNGGVSDLRGGYTSDDEGGLTFEEVATNLKPGPAELMDQEGRLVETLKKVASFEVDGAGGDDPAELELKNAAGDVILSLVEKS
ncbi:META domain-containing protein [Nocardioides sp. Y6]|uniref:META domain-containing protein n=1 Tax=Nocardioides malaquae TaxID=2773426 RepID=A0ABR9RTX2_9ACTN|nr:META domain-containing protein [Nocardioides malaquae]MBE7325039.1 META domain-containing protein [Nocardioides malaquae]